MYDIMVKQMRDEVTRLGAQELRTPQEVDATVPTSKGTMLVVINSTCGCAGGTARPALARALQHSVKPQHLTTVFASTDRDATARLRQLIGPEIPPSSPSFALFRDGKLVEMVHRYQIEGHSVDQVTKTLTDAFDRHCKN
jgi:putative YphP/YqiW family bacilliredoxin